jgi:hypothetical protein
VIPPTHAAGGKAVLAGRHNPLYKFLDSKPAVQAFLIGHAAFDWRRPCMRAPEQNGRGGVWLNTGDR